MYESNIKEELSINYINTLAVLTGSDYNRIEHDEDSTDAILKKVVDLGDGVLFQSMIGVQLKATSSKSQYSENKKEIKYKLKVKNYNDLCMKGSTPKILALLILPEDKIEWVKLTMEELIIKGRMYWINLEGNEPSKSKSSVSIRISKEQVLTQEQLNYLFEKIAREEKL